MKPSERYQTVFFIVVSYIAYRYTQQKLSNRKRCSQHNLYNCTQCYPLASMIDPISQAGQFPSDAQAPIWFEKVLLASLPYAYQTRLRDSGWFGTVADYGAVVFGTLFFITRPWLFIWFNSRHNIQRNIQFGGSKRLYLDVYHRGIHTDVAHTNVADTTNTLSNTAQSHNTLTKHKVVIFTHGGAWSSGNKFIYRLIGRTLRDAGYIVVIPNYRVFPYMRSSDDQARDINSCLVWTYNNIHKYNGDNNNIYLCGHSSGGHINTLLAFRRITETDTSDSIVHHKNIPIRGIINMGTPFDITDHYAFEHARGVVVLSPMTSTNGGSYDKLADYSPTQLIHQLTESQLYSLPPMLQIHSMSDVTVPPSSSERYAAALTKHGIHSDRCPVYLLKSPADHVTSILDLMLKQNTCEIQLDIIQKFIDKFSIDSSTNALTHKFDSKHIKHETLESIELPSHL